MQAISAAVVVLGSAGFGFSSSASDQASSQIANQIAIDAFPLKPSTEQQATQRAPELEWIAGFRLSGDHDDFGGYSALLVNDDGTLSAFSDTGHRLTLQPRWDRSGALTAINTGYLESIGNQDGMPFAHKRLRDLEAVTAIDGRILMAFEHRHRLAWLATEKRATQQTPLRSEGVRMLKPWLGTVKANAGVEAMAIIAPSSCSSERSLMVFTEADADTKAADASPVSSAVLLPLSRRSASPPVDADAPARRIDYQVPSGGDYRPVDAVALPNRHQILLLERAFSVFGGFRSRLSLIDVAPKVLCGSKQSATDQAPLPSRVLATLNGLIPAENYEGLALRESERGLHIFLISDDNQNFIQRTLLIQLRWWAED